MNDYKEIIKELNIEFNECDKLIGRKIHLNLSDAPPKKYEILAEDCCGEMVSIMQTISCAADAIEQLVKERDGWMISYDGAQRAYHEWFAEAQKLMQERDAAVEDLKSLAFCCKCKHNETTEGVNDICLYCREDDKWEWRGVQE